MEEVNDVYVLSDVSTGVSITHQIILICLSTVSTITNSGLVEIKSYLQIKMWKSLLVMLSILSLTPSTYLSCPRLPPLLKSLNSESWSEPL